MKRNQIKKGSFFFIVLLNTILILSGGCMTSPGTGKKAYPSGLIYELRMPGPHTHYFHISITIEKPQGDYIDMAMPAWSPGRYIIYDFAKHIHHIEVFSENTKTLLLTRLDKQTWRISGYGRGTLRLTYKVYANYASGTFSHLSSEGALINGASVFMYPVLARNIPVTLAVHLPGGKNWTIATSLPETGKCMYYADTYDHLIDSPLSIGDIRTYTCTSSGKPVHVCFQSPVSGTAYEKRLALNCKALCDAAGEIFGELPFSHYLFIFYTGFTPGQYDGMEHFHSSCITDASPLSGENHVNKLTALAAHELWHVWNIKCIRPYEFLSYHLEEELYTRSLWIVEGLTRYFQNILQLRAGIITREDFRKNFSHYITAYEVKPGKNTMTLEEASFLTWFDRISDEDTNSMNTKISYYNKGAVVGLLLDLKIRGLTSGKKGLEDVFKEMYHSFYKKGKGYTDKDFYSECEKTAGKPLHHFFERCIRGTCPLPYSECASLCGFILENNESLPVPDFGMTLNKTRIINIIPGSCAEKAGFQKYDEIRLVNNIPFAGISDLDKVNPGQILEITFVRYGRQMTLPLTAGQKIPLSFLFKERSLLPEEIAEIRESYYTGQLPGKKKK
ncbi:MAG: M61 family metallopeptidase [Spirochaetales bacterium]|nr:M61 family metallopeptidase [Spirochaetales bacterium]